MGAILIGLILFLLFAWISKSLSDNDNKLEAVIVFILAIVCGCVGCGYGVTGSRSDYHQSQTTSEIVSFKIGDVSEDSGNLIYIIDSGADSHTYFVEDYSGSKKTYESKALSGDNIKIVEEASFTDAKLVTFIKEPNRTFWTLGLRANEYEYVFYVPEGTVLRNVSSD